MKKILFLHGFFATGSCPMARALKEAFEGTAVVLAPDLPLHPKEALIEEFAELEAVQFDHCNPYYKNRVWGLFGEQDVLAHFSPLFLKHYNQAFNFPGGHTPTEQEVKTWYAPLAQKMMMEFSAKEERYFQHFKGGKYKFIHSAFDSETQERMVVYQALYGDQAYWVRPENMFFGKVTRDGRTFNRFTEIDKF